MFNSEFLENYGSFLELKTNSSFFLLVIFGFLGGLLSSLLPCILSLLPINLAYIGTLEIKNKMAALQKALQFSLGVAVVLTALGAFANLAFWVLQEYRQIINLIVGILIMLMGLSLLEIFALKLPNFIKETPKANPFVIGIIFALVSSPCSSPVLISVISISASLNSIAKGITLMFFYSIGYTAIIFLASLFTGFAKQLNWFKKNHDLLIKLSAYILIIIGVFYLFVGVKNLV